MVLMGSCFCALLFEICWKEVLQRPFKKNYNVSVSCKKALFSNSTLLWGPFGLRICVLWSLGHCFPLLCPGLCCHAKGRQLKCQDRRNFLCEDSHFSPQRSKKKSRSFAQTVCGNQLPIFFVSVEFFAFCLLPSILAAMQEPLFFHVGHVSSQLYKCPNNVVD